MIRAFLVQLALICLPFTAIMALFGFPTPLIICFLTIVFIFETNS